MLLSRLQSFCLQGLVLLAAGCVVAHAEQPPPPASPTLVLDSLGKGTIPLDGPWQFHPGDDMAWAAEGFDDSGWEQVDVSKPWGDQGHWAYAGHAWYRRHIEIRKEPNGAADISLYVPIASCAYEIYWNGRFIGRTDSTPGQSSESQPAAAIYRLEGPERGVLAFRVYSVPMDTVSTGDGQGLIALPRVGNSEAIADFAARERSAVVRSRLLTVVQILIYGQLSLVGVVVWWRNRSQKLPFWMSVFLMSAAFWTVQDPILLPWTQTNYLASFTTGGTNHSFEDIALWYLLLYLLDLDRYPSLLRWTRLLAWITFLSAVLDSLVFYMPSIDARAPIFQVLDAVFTAGFSVPEVFPLVLIVLAFRKRMDLSRRLVAIAAFLSDMYFVVAHTAEQGERFTRWTLYNTMTQPLFTVGGVDVSVPAILSMLLVCAIVYAAYRYMVEQGQRQTALQQEFRNARAVQQVLVPDDIPSVAGFSMQSVYKPFGEVGGDFFQILATRDGGVLAVIGDVSGKGMPAAMTVSLLVGTVRTLAHYLDSPAEILSAMNQRMLGRSQGGFTTCLVLRADADGALTVANAGHIAPYLAGRELPLENGLPLGLAVEATYVESNFQLKPREQLTLLTDGIVEAREKTGALFGFERTAAISSQSADQIAKTAELFGQDDDITVLTLTRQPATEESIAKHKGPVLVQA
jgi:hypothetical protein